MRADEGEEGEEDKKEERKTSCTTLRESRGQFAPRCRFLPRLDLNAQLISQCVINQFHAVRSHFVFLFALVKRRNILFRLADCEKIAHGIMALS
jgi:hypothetical protein